MLTTIVDSRAERCGGSRAVVARSVLALIMVLAAWLAAGPVRAQAESAESPPAEALVVPVYGAIGPATVALVRRAIGEAHDLGVAWLVLDIDTPGGLVHSMREVESLLASIRGSGVSIVSFVRSQALSAGGYLSLACQETYMAPGAVLGAITPIEVGPQGAQQIGDDDARRKMLSAFKADVRSLLERRGKTGDVLVLAEAMVDPRMRVFEVTYEDERGADVVRVVGQDELRGLENRGVAIRNQQELGLSTPLTLTADEAKRYGFSNGTFDTLQLALRDGIGVDPSAAVKVESSWSETTVDWLESMKLILFVFGFILLLVEVKTPGFAVPGALGLLLLALGLFSSYLVGLAEWTEILLFFLGVILIGIEIFVIPGTIVAGAAGFVALVAALVLSQQSFVVPVNETQTQILTDNLVSLLVLLLLVIAGTVVVWRFLPHVPVLNRIMLPPPSDPRTGDANATAKITAAVGGAIIGRTGTARTDLRPAGVMDIDGEPVDVVTEGGFVERGAALVVVDVSGNRVVVAPASASSAESGAASIPWLVLLLVLGFALVVAEIFFVSAGILSILAAVTLVSTVFMAFTHGQGVGFAFLAACAIGVPVTVFYSLRVLPRTRFGRILLLAGPEHERVTRAAEEPGIERYLGKLGSAISDLRPAGFAMFDGKRVDVVTRGEMIESGTAVRVVTVEGNRVVVAATNSDQIQ